MNEKSQQKDVAESARVRRHPNVRAIAKCCYRNAYRVVLHVPEYANADYVEGIAINRRGLMLEHGWVERDGVIVDPTLPNDDLVYFPGLRFRGPQGLVEALQIPKPEYTEDDLPILYRFGWGGIDSPEFRLARIAASRYVGMKDLARQYENYDESSRVAITDSISMQSPWSHDHGRG